MSSGAASPLARRLAPWLALSGLVLLVFLIVTPFLVPLVWAAVLAYASWPLAEWLRTRCGGRDTLAASLATLLAGLTLFAPLLWLAWLAQAEMGRLGPALQAFIAAPPDIPTWLSSLPWLGDWLAQQRAWLLADPEGVAAAARSWLTAHVGEAAQFAGGVGRNLAKLVLVLVILFFFYRDGARMLRELRHVLARFIGERTHGYLAAAGATTRAVVYGILLTALAQGVVAGAGYWVAGLGSPVTLGLLTALFALIPFATPLAWGGAGLWLLSQGERRKPAGGSGETPRMAQVPRPVQESCWSLHADMAQRLLAWGDWRHQGCGGHCSCVVLLNASPGILSRNTVRRTHAGCA
jgi:predicted PurR-regulated permease PerM